MFFPLPLPLIEMRRSISSLSPIHTPIQGVWDSFGSPVWNLQHRAILVHFNYVPFFPGDFFTFLRSKSNFAWYRVQAFIQQLVDTRPDMVTREVVGKTIVSFSTSTAESQNPRQRVSNADRKVFATPESFCDKFIIGWRMSGYFTIQNIQIICKVSGWTGKFPDNLKSVRII